MKILLESLQLKILAVNEEKKDFGKKIEIQSNNFKFRLIEKLGKLKNRS